MSQNPDFDQATGEKLKRDQGYEPRPESSNGRQMQVLGAVVLIGLGVVFLLQQFGIFIPLFNNWWALFILIPSVGALWVGFTAYNRAGMWTSEARSAIGGGTLGTLVGLIFLLNLDWGKLWPLFLIVPGVLLLFGMWGPSRHHHE